MPFGGKVMNQRAKCPMGEQPDDVVEIRRQLRICESFLNADQCEAGLASLQRALGMVNDALGRNVARRETSSGEKEYADQVPITGRDDVFSNSQGRILKRFSLGGRVALVTGAGQRIGRAFAHALGEAGAKVAVIDIVAERGEHVADELLRKGIESVAVTCDVTKVEQFQHCMDNIIERWGKVDIAVNNAGVTLSSDAEDTSEDEWDQTMQLNLKGVFRCCQVEGRHMLENGYGKIINTASLASVLIPHTQNQSAYNVSKAGVVQLTKSLAAEWAAGGIRVNCMSPGPLRETLASEFKEARKQDALSKPIPAIPQGRLAEVTDLQGGVVYLASTVSDYVTGFNLVIEGGQLLW